MCVPVCLNGFGLEAFPMCCPVHTRQFSSRLVLNQQGLQRRATPHPSELKVMKNVIEARRNEAYTAKPDEDLDSPDTEVYIRIHHKVSKPQLRKQIGFKIPCFDYARFHGFTKPRSCNSRTCKSPVFQYRIRINNRRFSL